MKITIGIPCNRQIKPQTSISLLEMVARGRYEFNFALESDGLSVATNRNRIVTRARQAKSDYLLFVDDDMKFPPETLDYLIEKGKRIIAVNARTRGFISRTIALRKIDGRIVSNKPFECVSIGTGIMLIELSVFSEIERPWFKIEMDDSGQDKLGEDIYFCEKAKSKGIEIWCDPSIKVKHIGDYEY